MFPDWEETPKGPFGSCPGDGLLVIEGVIAIVVLIGAAIKLLAQDSLNIVLSSLFAYG